MRWYKRIPGDSNAPPGMTVKATSVLRRPIFCAMVAGARYGLGMGSVGLSILKRPKPQGAGVELCSGLIGAVGKRPAVGKRERVRCDAENFFVVEDGFPGMDDTKCCPPERHAKQIHSGA